VQQLKWRIILLSSLALLILAAFNLLVLKDSVQEVISRWLLGMVIAFVVVHIAFAMATGLIDEARRDADQMTLLSEITRDIAASPDLARVLDAIVTRLPRHLGVEAASLLLQDAAGDLIFRAASGARAEEVKPLRVPAGRGIAGWVAAHGKPTIVLDVSQDPRFYPEIDRLTDFTTRSLACVPMQLEGQTIGVIEIINKVRGTFGGDDLRLLRAVADVAATAIAKARLFEEERKRSTQLALVNNIAKQVTAYLDIQSLMDAVTQSIHTAFGYDGVAVLTIDAETNELLLQSLVGMQWEITPRDYRQPMSVGLIGAAASSGQTVYAPDVDADPRYFNYDPACIHTRSELCIPLKSGQLVLGVLDIQSTRLNAFDAEDIRAMETLADQVAIALRNAYLYSREKRRFDEISFLHQVMLSGIAATDLDERLYRIVEAMRGTLKYENFGFLFVDQAEQVLRVHPSYYGVSRQFIEETRIPLGQGITGCVAQTGQARYVPDVSQTPEFIRVPGSDTRSEMCVPLKIGDKVTGVVNVESAQPDAFSPDDQRILTTLAAQVSLLIQNALLYRQVQEQLAELQRTQAQLVLTAKLGAVGELAAGMAHEINNPLTTILGNAELLLRKAKANGEPAGGVESILRAAQRANRVMRNLLDFSRQEAYDWEPCDINATLEQALALLAYQLERGRIVIHKEFASDLPWAKASRHHLEEVWVNLLLNARDALAQRPEPRIYLRTCRDGRDDWLRVEVEDNGVGIAPENLPRIFDPFFTTKPPGQGTGLGLYVAYQVIHRHGGTIEAHSLVGQGTKMVVRLPVRGPAHQE